MRTLPTWTLLLVAMGFPTLAAAIYFQVLADDPRMGFAYLGAKGLQASLPLVGWLALGIPREPAWRRPTAGLGAGLVTGIALGLGPALLYLFWLRASPLLDEAPAQIQTRLESLQATTVAAYIALALALSLAHSLFEEYYWRWFLFGTLRRRMPWNAALVLSSGAFGAHHAVVIAGLLGPGAPWALVVGGTLAVALGGAVWAWLFQRYGSLLSPWVSHAVVDLAVMAIGLHLWRA